MAILCPDSSSSIFAAITGTPATFSAGMAKTDTWLLVSNTGCFYKQGAHAAIVASPATAGNGSVYLAPNTYLEIDGKGGDDISIIQDSVAGKATLCRAVSK